VILVFGTGVIPAALLAFLSYTVEQSPSIIAGETGQYTLPGRKGPTKDRL
jgi:hypothetical protein